MSYNTNLDGVIQLDIPSLWCSYHRSIFQYRGRAHVSYVVCINIDGSGAPVRESTVAMFEKRYMVLQSNTL